MFEVAKEQKQYETFILKDKSAGSEIEVVPERGGIISRWRDRDGEIFYLDTQRFANREQSVRGGNPILFPICGNLINDTYTYQGREYKLKQHGFARDLPWQVTATKTNDCASITIALSSNDKTLAVYPFEFELVFTYQLQGNSLTILQQYTNKSQEVMPFSAGFHPYFAVTDKERLEFDIPSDRYTEKESQETHAFDGNFDFKREEIDVAFTSLHRQSATWRDRSTNRQIVIDCDRFYNTLVFWTVKGKDYICLEPWSAPRNALNTKDRLTYIEPGSTFESVLKLVCSSL
ncbi:aldose epimerase [Myxosarcina sp. GI1]|uniref:aldose epimerase family protein n=1 Tax=Myxosarcina sp. GI1 TaxID=1541065 RepID=UPI00056429C6|nr:aldose epimerase [Myxosarcina sp. GI1]